MQNRRKRGPRKWQPTPMAAYTLTEKLTCGERRRNSWRLLLMLLPISSSRSNQQPEGGATHATQHFLTQTERVGEREREIITATLGVHPFTCGCSFVVKGQLASLCHLRTTF